MKFSINIRQNGGRVHEYEATEKKIYRKNIAGGKKNMVGARNQTAI